MDWQLPVERGFNASFGFLGGGEDHISQNGMLMEWGCHGTDLWSSHQPAIGQNGTYSGYIYNDAAVDIIKRHIDVDTNPLFIYLATQTMHAPLEVPTRWSDLYPNTSVHDASDSTGSFPSIAWQFDLTGALVYRCCGLQDEHKQIRCESGDGHGVRFRPRQCHHCAEGTWDVEQHTGRTSLRQRWPGGIQRWIVTRE